MREMQSGEDESNVNEVCDTNSLGYRRQIDTD